MSTVPPPYHYDPRTARRAAAAQAKAVRDSYKAQRQLVRDQQRSLRRSSILGPVLLVGIGIAALFVSTGRWPALSFTGWYARWWPALLVLAGVVLLGEWALDQYTSQNAASPPLRRRVGGGVVALLILAAFLGATSRTVHDQHDLIANGLSLNHDNLFELFSDKRTLPPQILDQALPALAPGAVLSIDNPHGDVTITGSSTDGNLHITVNKQVYASDSTAQAKGDQLNPVFTASASALSLNVPNVDGGSADLTLLVPASLALSITTSHGGINVTGLNAPLIVNTSHGDVELESVTGTVSAHVSHRDSSFSAHHITGDLTLKGNLDDVNLTDIKGQTYLEGDFYGDSHFERLLGPVTFQTSKTHFTLGRIDGNVDLDSSDITGSHLAGPISLRVKSRDVSFDHISGDLDILDSNGTINLTSAAPGNVNVVNTNGPISLTMPDKAGFTLRAAATSGAVENDFSPTPSDPANPTTSSTTIGDGKSHLTLQTTHANITLHKGSLAE